MPKKQKSSSKKGRSGGASRSSGSRVHKQAQTQHLNDLLTTKMQSLLDVENQLVKALPKMASKSTDPDLKAGFEKHLEETKNHVTRLEDSLDMLGVSAKKIQVDAIRGLVADADWVIKNVKGSEALDANLIAAAQYVEHYEMAGYGSAIEWAKLLGHDDVAALLTQTLEEEKNADSDLNELAQLKINERAMAADGEGGDDEDDDEKKKPDEGDEVKEEEAESHMKVHMHART